jgi:hypothetical protein
MSEMRLVDEVTMRAVCSYLHEMFPEKRVVPRVTRGVQEFRIDDIYGMPLHTLALSGAFFDAHAAATIPAVLRQFETAEALRRAGRAVVEVSDAGVTVRQPGVGRPESSPQSGDPQTEHPAPKRA